MLNNLADYLHPAARVGAPEDSMQRKHGYARLNN